MGGTKHEPVHTARLISFMIHHTPAQPTRCTGFKTPAIGMNKTRTAIFIETILRDTPHAKQHMKTI